jgi:hypothetical protein
MVKCRWDVDVKKEYLHLSVVEHGQKCLAMYEVQRIGIGDEAFEELIILHAPDDLPDDVVYGFEGKALGNIQKLILDTLAEIGIEVSIEEGAG